MSKERLLLVVSIIVLAAFSRLLPHPQNVAPVAAIALFAGAMLPRTLAFLVPLAAMLLADMVIGFHSTMLFVYAGMMLTVGIGMLLRTRLRALPLAAASVASSVLFFIISNVGVWLMEGIYPHTAEGLAACFVAAIPFFTNSLLGDLAFTAAIFGVFAVAEKRVSVSA